MSGRRWEGGACLGAVSFLLLNLIEGLEVNVLDVDGLMLLCAVYFT